MFAGFVQMEHSLIVFQSLNSLVIPHSSGVHIQSVVKNTHRL
jgi:hypothetical protein